MTKDLISWAIASLITAYFLWNTVLPIYYRKSTREIKHLRRKLKRKGFVLFVFYNLKIKGAFMDLTVKRSQFKKNEDGSLTLDGHIEPKDDSQVVENIEDGTAQYFGDNDSVATISQSEEDQKKFRVIWVGAGKVNFSVKADADTGSGVNEVFGAFSLTLVEDQATHIDMVLDGVN